MQGAVFNVPFQIVVYHPSPEQQLQQCFSPVFFFLFFKLKLGSTPCKAEQEAQKEAQKDQSIQEISLEGTYS